MKAWHPAARGWVARSAVLVGAFLIGGWLVTAGIAGGAGEETDAATPADLPAPTAMSAETPLDAEEPPATAMQTELPTEAATPSEMPTASPSSTGAIEALESSEGSEIALTISTGDGQVDGVHIVDFGLVGADGDGGGVPDESGAFYEKSEAVTVTVSGGAEGWTGACSAAENTGASSMSIAGGALAWRVHGTTNWVDFTTSEDATCFPDDERELIFDYRLLVRRSDSPGNFKAVITYHVSS